MTTDHLDHLLKRLHLAHARRIWRDLCQRAETEQWSFEDFTRVLVEEEVAHRVNTRIQRVARKAELPFLKTIEEFNFQHQSTLRLQMMGSFLSPDFVTEGRNLVLSGKAGRGKTHLATAIAYRAIQNGFTSLFTTCAALVDDLSSVATNRRGFREGLLRYTGPDVLVVDEVGYLTYSHDAANVLFHVVNERHLKKKSMLFTTNKPFSSWGAVLHDEDLAQAILDRVFERGRRRPADRGESTGQSFRNAGARVSGTHNPIEVAPPDQVMQQLLSPESVLVDNSGGFNVILLRLDEAFGGADGFDASQAGESLDLLMAGLEQSAARSASTHLLYLCPSTTRPTSPAAWAWLNGAPALVRERLAACANVRVVDEGALFAAYPVADVADLESEKVGGVPYTTELFAALATHIARTLHALRGPPFKVIALDCDNTLWSGVVGEDGPAGVRLTEQHRRLQEMMVRQVEQGALVCLVSKNNEADVWEAFAKNPHWPLQREHVTAARIGWLPKSQGLRELSAQLGLGLDSFVFIDDSAMECAEVAAAVPEVVSLQLPDVDVDGFLQSIWALDRTGTTQEDRERTALYRQHAQREAVRTQMADAADFLQKLELRVEIEPLTTADVARVAELTQRTNQFNATTIRRTEAEVAALLSDEERRCLVVRVRDRFGDYGLVGAVIYDLKSESLCVDTLLLSCRALARGVEHAMLEELGRVASAAGKARVDVCFTPTQKNQPARAFLTRFTDLVDVVTAGKSQVFRFPVEVAREASRHAKPTMTATPTATPTPASAPAAPAATLERARLLERIARELRSARDVLIVLSKAGVRHRGASAFAAPSNDEERLVAAAWAEVLRLDMVGIDDDFFAFGGTSLQAVQAVARVRRRTGCELGIAALFSNPTPRAFARHLAAVSKTAAKQRSAEPVRRQHTERLPLSQGQQRLWFVDAMAPGVPVYNIPLAWRLEGGVDRGALRGAVADVVRRHQAVRVVFASEGNDLHGVDVGADPRALDAAFREVDLQGADEEAVIAAVNDAARQPFDLTKDLLLRVTLFKVSSSRHVLLLNLHHAAGDGWSMGVLANELGAAYRARRGAPSALPELALQFVDVVAWQDETLASGALQQQLDYWKAQLKDLPALLELPTDRARPATTSYAGSLEPIALSSELSRALADLARREGATPFMVLLAGLQALLSRYTGSKDIPIGVPVAGRPGVEAEKLIGYFANTVVMRGDCSGDPSFRALLARVRKTTLEGFANSDVPTQAVTEAVNPPRLPNANPLFQVMLAYQPPGVAPALGSARAESLLVDTGTSKFDLLWSLGESQAGFAGHLEYSSDLFDRATARRMTGHLLQLLESALAAPDTAISKLRLLTTEEEKTILGSWIGETVARPSVANLIELLAPAAAERPDDIAVISADDTLTYRQLQERSDIVARELQRRGVGRDELVGVALERGSSEILVGILGVLKAGGAYVPLDPDYPADRVAYMLKDAQARVLLTQRRLQQRLPQHDNVLLVDDLLAQPASRAEPVTCSAQPGDLAYVIYTSGSTGNPKGVAIEHRSSIELMHWARDTFTREELAGVLCATSVCFDLSIFEMFVPLMVGGTVILAKNALELPLLQARDQVTLVNTVPSAMAELVRQGQVPPSVRVINLAGEPLPRELADAVYAGTNIEKLYNLYGPTEDTTYSTGELVARGAPVRIGRPLPNTRAYILDAHGQPVPAGVSGELHLAGAGLARGYLNREELTAAKFVNESLSTTPSVMYRTGDLCRWLPDGTIDYLGRLDHQVKIRGFRIELGEVENALRQIPGVRDVVVSTSKPADGPARLIAHLTATPTPGVQEMRAFLQRSLPDYMIPSAFVVLDAMPLTPNGKIDRKQLPAPDFSGERTSRVPPRNEVEAKLLAIWSEHLAIRTSASATTSSISAGTRSWRCASLRPFAPPSAKRFRSRRCFRRPPSKHSRSIWRKRRRRPAVG